MTGLATFIQASAHSLPTLADGSVQMIATSPPYYGLRAYAGEQGVEWPEVTYRLNEWVEPITVPGCDPNCEHEWTNEIPSPKFDPRTPEQLHGKSTLGPKRDGLKSNNAAFVAEKKPATQGSYCARCGGWRGGLGMEPSPVAYIGHLILCLREWRRVLRDDGICFVNLGDSYVGATSQHKVGGSAGHNSVIAKKTMSGIPQTGRGDRNRGLYQAGLKMKDLLMIPAMFAIAARADGWWLRSDIVWAKPNPMPESVTDRPTKAHEYIFLLAKSARYYWDADAVREPHGMNHWGKNGGGATTKYADDTARGRLAVSLNTRGYTAEAPGNPSGRNLRTVWNVSTSPFPGAHFACWPEKLVEPMIKAGTSERGACPQCGKPWERVTETERTNYTSRLDRQIATGGAMNGGVGKNFPDRRTTDLGFRPACTCPPHEPVPCVVLDPFVGSGTTVRTAIRLGRRAIGVDVSNEYLTTVVSERMGDGVQMTLPGTL